MALPTIYLAFTDDWELKGDGSGDLEEIQLAPMRKLLSIYEGRGIRSTTMAEMMQQLTFREQQGQHPELRPLADAWDEHVLDAHRRGHDIQLHIHPQWSDHEYRDGKWSLRGSWGLPSYSSDETNNMIGACKGYLENLLSSGDPDYRCRAFRAGASAIGPAESLLPALVAHEIDLDISIIKGYRVNTRNLKLDFTLCAEGRLPYYPRMDDARAISDQKEAIVCMPLFQFRGSRSGTVLDIASKIASKVAPKKNGGAGYADEQWASLDSRAKAVMDKVVSPILKGQRMVADLGKLGQRFLPEVLPAARRHARESGLAEYPVVLSNHSKNVKDFDAIERFVDHVAAAPDVQCVTLTEMADKIRSGSWPVRLAN